MEPEIYSIARDFARERHAGQIRKLPGGLTEPYHAHVIRVSLFVADEGGDQAAILAAILHDVVEDTPTTLEEVRTRFGDEVARYVDDLSDKYTAKSAPGLNRKARKAAEVARIALTSDAVHLVKLCDLFDNLRDTDESKGFGGVFAAEAGDLLAVLRGPEALRERVEAARLDLLARHKTHEAKRKAEKAAKAAEEAAKRK